MAIPILVHECFDAFSLEFAGEDASYLEDELGRFKIWAGNIAAHRPAHSRRSLEYRLRDSSGLKEMVLSLLQDLLVAIRDLRKQLLWRNTLVTHETPTDDSTASTTHEGTRLPPIDTEYEEVDMFELSDEESIDEDTPVHQALSEVHDVITCLLRFSMTLRRPSRDDQRRGDPEGVAEAFVVHDTEHVRAKFPEAPDYLVRRLGMTLSKHRQYFRYRREHHQKLYEDLDGGDVRDGELPSTVATSLPTDKSKGQNPDCLGVDSETESAYTATSYAGTSTGNATLHVPSWPIDAQAGSPFECPICFSIIVADSEISWRKHVFEDLPPYICVSETCVSAVKSFSRRREWARHNDTMHERTRVCPYACVKPMSSPIELSSHLAAEHAHTVLPHNLQKTTIASKQKEEANASLSCPLCTRSCNSTKSWTKHVGHHLEQLALFSLPMELFSTDAPEDSDRERIDDDGHSSARSSSLEHREDDDKLPGDSRSDAEDMKASEPLPSEAPIPIVNTTASHPLQPNEIHPATHEMMNEHDNQPDFESTEETVERMILGDDPTLEEDTAALDEVKKLREMIKIQEDERIAREAAIIAAEQAVEAETAAAKNKPLPDIDQAPIRFKDAVGRKFAFPWHICKTWKGMESLINKAFLHVDLIGVHVQEGRYDLVGPDGEIILPQVWQTMVKPGWAISMHMWPLPESARTPNNHPPTEATVPNDYLPAKSTKLRGFMEERQDERPDDASSSVKRPKKEKEVPTFEAWMAGLSPKPSKPGRSRELDRAKVMPGDVARPDAEAERQAKVAD